MAKPMKTPIRLDRKKPLKSRWPSTDQAGLAARQDRRPGCRATAIAAAISITAAARTMPARNLATTTRETPGLEGEGHQAVALAGLAGDQHDDEDRQEVAEHPAGDAEEVLEVLVVVVRRRRRRSPATTSTSATTEIATQRPARVSSALRSSTRASRVIGTCGVEDRSIWPRAGCAWCSRRGSFREGVALGVGGELEEQVLQAGGAGPELGEHDAALGRDPPDVDGRRPRPGAPSPVTATSKPFSFRPTISASSSSDGDQRAGRTPGTAASACRPGRRSGRGR